MEQVSFGSFFLFLENCISTKYSFYFSGSPSNLIDYSSAEDEQSAADSVRGVRRRTSTSSRNSNSSAAVQRRSSRSNTPLQTNGGSNHRPNGKSNGLPNGRKRLSNFSETEEDSDEDEEDEESEEDLNEEEEIVDEEDEDDELEDEEEEEEEEDDEEEVYDRGIQTSPGLDDTNVARNRLGKSNRFMSSTPTPPVKNTSSFLSASGSNTPAFSFSSPLRRGVAANSQAFGSLGEVLATLPSSRNAQFSTPNNKPSLSSSNTSSTTTAAADITTQATPRIHQQSMDTSYSKQYLTSHTISKITLLVACLFFLLLSYKYASLRPSPDIKERIPVCGATESDTLTCVPPDQVENVALLFKDLMRTLERHGVDQMCSSAHNDSSKIVYGMSVEQALERLSDEYSLTESEEIDYYDDEDKSADSEPVKLASNLLRPTMTMLIALMRENPQWGIKVQVQEMDSDNEDSALGGYNFEQTDLTVTTPPVNWSCWLSRRFGQLLYMLSLCMVYLLYAALASGLSYAGYRLHVWRQEKRLREHQDVFELVEQVLSMLVTQHQLSQQNTPRANAGKPCLAINHIRDQLIPPQDRKRKKNVWSKVVKYIRESESRVREDVKTIYGEEHLVWQWIPDIHWSPMHGPNPYVVSAAVTPSTFSSTPQLQPAMTPKQQNNSPASPQSPSWQGSAFNTLNRNVAAPMVAPTSCLKVRHMFSSSQAKQPSSNPTSPHGWAWEVKEEILRRCALTQPPAVILHVAVDTASTEGCVYIKANSTEEAGKVFRTLHGQWYRGNLVTVKYLREERYHERFPDAKYQREPLRPSTARLLQ